MILSPGTRAALVALLLLSGCGTTLRVFEENDVGGFGGGTDRYYTQGLRIELTRPLEGEVPVISPIGRFLWLYPEADAYLMQRQYVSLAGGHKIFTPEDITVPTLQVDDRPYAGWLYGAVTHHNLALGHVPQAERANAPLMAGPTKSTLFSRDDRLDSLEVQIGIVGPSSLAEDVQTEFHEWIGAKRPEGWDNQLSDELGVNVVFTRKIRHNHGRFAIFGLEHDLITTFGGSGGNVESYVLIGGQMRVGGRLRRDFGIEPGGADIGLEELRRRLEQRFPDLSEHELKRLNDQFGGGFSWYVFAGVEGRFVINNIFLDGNTSKDSHSVNKERFVADFKLGIALQFRSFEISYTQVARTPEFRRASDPQIFGSLNVAFRF